MDESGDSSSGLIGTTEQSSARACGFESQCATPGA